MNTRVKNKTAHPGFPDKAKTCQSSAEVQQECMAKAQAKAAREKAKQNSVQRTAKFKLAALVEDSMSQSWNQAYSSLTPIPATSNVETSDFNRALFEPAKSESLAENDTESAAESDPPAPLPKKLKSHSTRKATAATTKATKRRKKPVDESEDEAMASRNAEPCRVPNAKKTRVRDEIDVAAKKIREDKYGNMVDAMSQGAKDTWSSQRRLKKEAATSSDIVPLSFEEITATNSYQESKHSKRNKGDKKAIKQKHCETQTINKWAAGVPNNAAPASHGAPSYTTAPTTSHSKTEAIAVFSDAGLSDNDETNGEERLVTINSPPKGKMQITSEQLVVQKPRKLTSKKTRAEELPTFITAKWFQFTFVSTYMTFVAQSADPWEVPAMQAVEVMQKIWNTTSSFEYNITTSTATVQRCTDLWHNIVGSTGIAVLLAFFNSQEHFQVSDELHQIFAKYYIDDLCFLYKDSEHEDRNKWKGLFHSPLVVQTFAVHLTAMEGALKVPGLHDPPHLTPAANGGLGLAVASVERALTLVVTGTLTVAMAQAARGKMITLPRTLNLSTSKDSTCQTGFSDTAWGKATWSYAKSASVLSKKKFDVIVEDAQKYVKPVRACNRGGTATGTTETKAVDKDDICTHLVKDSDSDANSGSDANTCKFFPCSFSLP
ncbi:hypothetical protein V8E53_011107 [Lactarius tabidus]